MSVSGILNTIKPAGRTSFEMVALVRRLSGERRVGHGGTLDPAATGVLPICLGQGTRVTQFLAEARKLYRAEIELGIATDTYDASGRVTERGDAFSATREQAEKALASFLGSIKQTPPMYSAVKHEGKPLYRLARAGIEVPRKARDAEVFRLDVLDWQPPVITLEVECGKGTYIRSLAHDLGGKLGCGAHLRNLVRLRSGLFDISDGITVSQLEDAFHYGYWKELLYPIDAVLLHWMAAIVGKEGERTIETGRPLLVEQSQAVTSLPQRCRAYSLDGHIIALLRFEPESGLWQPDKVFSA